MSKEKTKKQSDPQWRWRYQRNRPTAGRRGSGTARLIFQSLVSFAAAAVFAFIFHHYFIAGILAGVGLLILASGLFIPRLYRAIEWLGSSVAVGVGQVLTWLLLVPFYYLCFLPGRIILALTKHDPMNRGWDSSKTTYWTEKHSVEDSDGMTRQY